MKKVIITFSAILMVLCGMVCVDASAEEVSVLVDSVKIDFDVQPQIIDGRTMVPVRAIFDAIGAVVKWDGATQTVYAKKGTTEIKMTIGNRIMKKNEKPIELDVGPMILDGRTLVPARAVAESFNCLVDYDGNTKTVIISPVSDLDIPVLSYGVPGYGQATLFGDEIDDKEAGYQIYYSLDEKGPYYENISYLTSIGKDGVIIRDLEGYKRYYFKIRAERQLYNEEYDAYETFYSNFSNPIVVKPVDALNVVVEPPKIKNAKVNGTNVTLYWDIDPTYSSYTVYIDGTHFLIYGCDKLYSNSYTFTDLEPNTKYEFSLIGTKEVKEQSYSSEFSEKYIVTTGDKSDVLPPNVTVSNVKYKTDSVGGIEYTFDITNNSDKEVKYVTLSWQPTNAVGDNVYDTISGDVFSAKFTGPIESGEIVKNCKNERKFYNSTANSIKWVKIKVEYTDGTYEIINNGWMH